MNPDVHVAELRALLTLPKAHLAPRPLDWAEVSNQLGSGLPRDYRELLESIGGGGIADLIWIYDPLASKAAFNLLVARDQYELAHESAARYGDRPKFPAFPVPGGLLPWGHSTQGDQLLWKTVGRPDRWTVVVESPRAAERYEEHPCGMAVFLCGIVSGHIKTDLFPDGFPVQHPRFKPLAKRGKPASQQARE